MVRITAYYLLQLGCMRARMLHGKKDCWKWWLPLITWRNVSALCAHGLMGLLSTTTDGSFRTEMPVEHFYGRVKRTFRGQPCIKDGLYGTALEHLEQLHRSRKEPAGPDRRQAERQGLPTESLPEISKEAFRSACRFFMLITCSDNTAVELGEQFRKWWFEARCCWGSGWWHVGTFFGEI